VEKLGDTPERQIMPNDLFEHYVKARIDTYASGKEPVLGLNIPGLRDIGFQKDPERMMSS